MQRNKLKGLVLILWVFFTAIVPVGYGYGASKILNVPEETQEQDQWCWAACSQALLSFFKKEISQCRVADFARDRQDCCSKPEECNDPNYMYGIAGSIEDILNHWCVSSAPLESALGFAECKKEINNDRPFLIRYEWWEGGGHFLVVRGYATDSPGYLHIMDPWPGNGHGIFTYNYVKKKSKHHTWTHTVKQIVRSNQKANWKVSATTPVKSGETWNYNLSIIETLGGCGRIKEFSVDFLDEVKVSTGRQTYTKDDFAEWFDECPDKGFQLPRETRFCGDMRTHLGGRASGYVRYRFVIRCDEGSSITRSKLIYLPAEGGSGPVAEKTCGAPAVFLTHPEANRPVDAPDEQP
jgi:hypothetical protein